MKVAHGQAPFGVGWPFSTARAAHLRGDFSPFERRAAISWITSRCPARSTGSPADLTTRRARANTPAMARLVGLSGSLRKESFNTKLLRAAAALVPEGTTVDVHTIEGIPLYDGDVEAADGVPAAASALKDAIAAGDGLLLVTPEYNNSLPGPMKNAIDWASRPPGDAARVFRGRPVALLGATIGPGGTGLAQAAWLPVVRALGMLPWFGGRVQMTQAASAFDAAGVLVDEKQKAALTTFVAGFAAFVDAIAASKVRSR
jgi:NAD(P)H-dependent FMN reductase